MREGELTGTRVGKNPAATMGRGVPPMRRAWTRAGGTGHRRRLGQFNSWVLLAYTWYAPRAAAEWAVTAYLVPAATVRAHPIVSPQWCSHICMVSAHPG